MAPFNVWPLGVLSMAGFATLIYGHTHHQTPLRFVFQRSLSYGIGVYAAGASWIFVSIHDYGHASIALSLLLITPFIVFLSLLLTVPFVVFSKLRDTTTANAHDYTLYPRAIFMLLIFPSLWTISEWFRGWVFSGFPWLYLGYGHTDTWLSGWAPIAGVLGISWITAFCGALLGFAFTLLLRAKTMNVTKKDIALPLSSGLLLTTFFWLSGAYLQTVTWTQPTGNPLSIGLVQPALPLSLKWDPHQLPTIFAQYRTDTAKLLHNDLVVWPESAIPRFQHEVAGYLAPITAEANNTNTALITGIPTAKNPEGDNTNNPNSFYSKYYNSVIGLGQASGIYHKQHLVPFGEYVPFEKWLRGTIAFFDLPMSTFNSGPKDQQHITAKGAIIATAICYEIAYSELVRKSAYGANLLLTLSNDTWFGKSIGPKQHFQIARMRAIENRKPLIRATNDGISALITADGQIAATIPSFQRNTLEGTLEPRDGQTPFGRLGSYPIILLSFLLALTGPIQTYRSKKTAA
jgi:apolipoprotein N-acyltransferase